MASAGKPPAGFRGQSSRWGAEGRSSPEADEHTFLRWFGACSGLVVADLTEATGQRRTFDTAAILSVND